MATPDHHRQMAEDSLSAAECLRAQHPWWAVVALFYSALQLMHARFHEDNLSSDMVDPERHRSRRDDQGNVIEWGTTDIVVRVYQQLSAQYRSLFSASRIARYSGGAKTMATERFWADYDKIADFVGARRSSRHDPPP